MAFPVEKVYLAASPDSILQAGTDVIQNFAATTNQYDRDINAMICLAVIGVCFIVCLAVFGCFIVVSRMRRHAKEKDHELELEKLNFKKEEWKLQKEEEIKELSKKLKKEEWELEMSIERKEKENRDKIIELEKNLAEAKAVIDIYHKCFHAQDYKDCEDLKS